MAIRAGLRRFLRRWDGAMWITLLVAAALVLAAHPRDYFLATALTLLWVLLLALEAGLCYEASRPLFAGRRDRVVAYLLAALMVLPGTLAWTLILVASATPSGLWFGAADSKAAALLVMPFLLPMAAGALVASVIVLRRHGAAGDAARFTGSVVCAPLVPLGLSVAVRSVESAPWVGGMLLVAGLAFRRVLRVARRHIVETTEPQRLYPE